MRSIEAAVRGTALREPAAADPPRRGTVDLLGEGITAGATGGPGRSQGMRVRRLGE